MTNPTSISTKTLDHIVHLTPPGTVPEVSQQFRDLGFNVIPGGTHSDGLTANALVILADGVYLELISFTHPASHYPLGSPERKARDSHHWAVKAPGWIDFAFLGNGSLTTRISDIINARAKEDGSDASYSPEWALGRKRPDGVELKWVMTSPSLASQRGILPFFCGDITPRKLRVPTDPPSNTEHPSTAQGISSIVILTRSEDFPSFSRQLTSVIGNSPIASTDIETTWRVDTGNHENEPRLVLRAASSDSESSFVQEVGTGVYEVAFAVKDDGKKGDGRTPYGRIAWV